MRALLDFGGDFTQTLRFSLLLSQSINLAESVLLSIEPIIQ